MGTQSKDEGLILQSSKEKKEGIPGKTFTPTWSFKNLFNAP